jgi:hypothetical protein
MINNNHHKSPPIQKPQLLNIYALKHKHHSGQTWYPLLVYITRNFFSATALSDENHYVLQLGIQIHWKLSVGSLDCIHFPAS